MSLALGEHWLAILRAIPSSLLWEEGAGQRELMDFSTRLGSGECPSMSEDPAPAERLKQAFQDPNDHIRAGLGGDL